VPNSRIIAGEYPGDLDPARAKNKLNALLSAGVNVFVDLTEDGELDPYESLLREETEDQGASVAYVRLPIRDLRVPTLDEMQHLQQVLSDAETQGKTAYVHCWGGVGRTGTVIGCHLIERGYSPEEALELVQQLFGEMSPTKLRDHPGGSPETNAQREFVRQWALKRSKAQSSAGDTKSIPSDKRTVESDNSRGT
jgi:protein-tyrosine phosphatase